MGERKSHTQCIKPIVTEKKSVVEKWKLLFQLLQTKFIHFFRVGSIIADPDL